LAARGRVTRFCSVADFPIITSQVRTRQTVAILGAGLIAVTGITIGAIIVDKTVWRWRCAATSDAGLTSDSTEGPRFTALFAKIDRPVPTSGRGTAILRTGILILPIAGIAGPISAKTSEIGVTMIGMALLLPLLRSANAPKGILFAAGGMTETNITSASKHLGGGQTKYCPNAD
jgi:hypothetical protein